MGKRQRQEEDPSVQGDAHTVPCKRFGYQNATNSKLAAVLDAYDDIYKQCPRAEGPVISEKLDLLQRCIDASWAETQRLVADVSSLLSQKNIGLTLTAMRYVEENAEQTALALYQISQAISDSNCAQAEDQLEGFLNQLLTAEERVRNACLEYIMLGA